MCNPKQFSAKNFISMTNFKCYRRERENKLKDHCQFLLIKWFTTGKCIIKQEFLDTAVGVEI